MVADDVEEVASAAYFARPSLITNHCSTYKNRSRGTIQCYYLFRIFALNRKRWLAISHGQLGKEHGQSHEKHKYGRCCCDGGSDYNWIALPMYAHTKLIPRRTRRAMTIPRPPLESSQQGGFRSAVSIFVRSIFGVSFLKHVKTGSQQK